MSMPDDYQIPDDRDNNRMDADYLRTCLGLSAKPGEAPPEFPEAVRRAHYDMSRPVSLLGAAGPTGMTMTQLAVVVVLARREGAEVFSHPEVPPKEPPQAGFMDEVNEGRVKSGQKVVYFWQKKDQAAHFIKKDGDRLRLLVKGDEVRARPDLVRLPEEGEFPDVPDNINETETVEA